MRKETFLRRIITKFLKKIGLIVEYEVDNSEMCRKAVASGMCPDSCETCAWKHPLSISEKRKQELREKYKAAK